MNEDESGYYDEDDKILRDNNKLISSMKFDDIKLETYDRVFNRSFINPIGSKLYGKSLANIPRLTLITSYYLSLTKLVYQYL